jgi:tetratricopeptide (TPR) repeat protein
MITADLVNVSDGSEIWGGQYSRNMADVSTLQQEITNDIASKLRSQLTGEQQKKMAQSTTQNPEAYQFYLKGRNALHKRGVENVKQSIALFKQAIAADPAYAPAYAALADAYNIAPSWTGMSEHEALTQSLATAHKALELDPQLGDAHAALAAALVDSFQWAEAEKEFRRALELEPNNAQFHYAYAFLYLVAMGQMDAALGEFRDALLLDPLSGIINTNYAYTLSAAHRYDEAVQQFRKTLEMDPNFSAANRKFAQTYAAMGKWAEADQQYRIFALSPSATAKGFAELYRTNLAELSKQGQVGDILWALSYAAEGDREQAMAWLQKSAANHGSEFAYEIRDPLFDPLRSDPRYIQMMHDVGLPQ